MSYAGTYIVYAIQNNCISPDTSFQVIIKQSPTKPIITTINPLCIGDNLNLQSVSSLPNGTPNATLLYTWNGPGRGFPFNTANAEINNVIIQDEGIYTITVYSPSTGCSSQTDTLIRIGGYPIVSINAGNELVLPTGQILVLSSTIVNASDPHILPINLYEWSPNTNIECNDPICSAPLATIKNDVCYSVNATNSYGCNGRDTICVKVFCENTQVYIPNAFTPNGDGANDILMVRGKGIAKVKSFRIFNRWGEIVFERNDFPPNDSHYGWDGRIKGIVGEPAVYVYTAEAVCENGSVFFYKGNTTILK
jgi:gliding motility-associated-like protein